MIARALLCVLAAVVVAGLVSTPQSTVIDDALCGLAVGAALLVPLVLLYVVARIAPRHGRYQRGNIRAAGLGLVFLVAVAGYTLRCRPNLPPVSGCTPYARRCSADGYTEVCSASQRWHRDGDVPCSRIEQVCVAGACVDPPDASLLPGASLPADGDASTDGGAR